jgi:hypothetical protein
MNGLTPELIADIEEAFLGYWDDEVMAIVLQPYTAGALAAYARRAAERGEPR